MKNFKFEMTKVYSGIPPPPSAGLQSGRSYVETDLYPPWIPLVVSVFAVGLMCVHQLDLDLDVVQCGYRPPTKLREGNIFIGVSVRGGGGYQAPFWGGRVGWV